MSNCICQFCANEFSIPDAWIRKGGGKYCSNDCKSQAMRKPLVNTPTYISWKSMKARCDNVNDPNYMRYGGRGITYCERWSDFQNFLDDMGERLEGTTIGRIDNDGNYEPNNCRWENNEQQANNRSIHHYVEYKGQMMTLAMAAKASGIDHDTLSKRITAGDTGDRLFRKKKGEMSALARKYGIHTDTLAWRLRAGWSIEQATQQKVRGSHGN